MFSNRRATTAYPADADVEAFAARGAARAPAYGYAARDAAAEEDEAVAFERELLAGLNIDFAPPAGASETAYADEAYDPALYGAPGGETYGAEGTDPYAYDPNAYDQQAAYDQQQAAYDQQQAAYGQQAYEPWPDAAYPDIAEGTPYGAAEEDAYAASPAVAAGTTRRGGRLALLAIVLLAVGGAGAVAMTFLGDVVSRDPVVVHAPEDPFKIVAEATPDVAPAGASVVFAGDESDKIEERIVARDETAAPLYDDAEALSPFEGGPRRVRTVVVRPDGTIVDTPASTAELTSPIVDETAMTPVEIDSFPATPDMTSDITPDAPLMAGLPDDAPEEVGALPAEWTAPVEAAPAAPPAAAETPATVDGPLLLEAAASAPAELTTAPVSGAAPAEVAAAPAPAAPEPVAPEPAAATTTPPAPGSYVQVSSQRSEEAAQQTFADLQRRFPAIFSGQTANVQRADLGDRGIYYRLRVGPMASSNVANEFCMMFRSSGGDCLVVSN